MTDTEVLIRDCLASYAEDAELVDLVRPAKSRSRQLSRTNRRTPSLWHRKRLVLAAGLAAVALLVGTAFVLGGRQSVVRDGTNRSLAIASRPPTDFGVSTGRVPLRHRATGIAPNGAAATGDNSLDGAFGPLADNSIGAGVTATRVVKTGSMSLTVRKGGVQSAVTQLVDITTHFGGYVSQSRTDDIDNSPTGEVTLRMPVTKFEAAITAAEKVGHQTALTTNAHDVTGKFVDLNARLSALQRTRQTYLTILGRATTIGQTLSIQQRIEDVQSQIERLQGELKVLRNQSADGTLTVDVAEAGSAAVTQPHHRSGIGKAWHDSVSRFSRGIDAIVGALGPLLLALILLGLATLIIRLGLRHIRRATT